MSINQEIINDTFCRLIPYPNGNIMTIEGFEVLANWGEQQEWWQKFVWMNDLDQNWRSTYLGDPYVFALLLFRFIMKSVA